MMLLIDDDDSLDHRVEQGLQPLRVIADGLLVSRAQGGHFRRVLLLHPLQASALAPPKNGSDGQQDDEKKHRKRHGPPKQEVGARVATRTGLAFTIIRVSAAAVVLTAPAMNGPRDNGHTLGPVSA